MRTRRYSELVRLDSFEERFEYLSLRGAVGQETFGFDRFMNQQFYRSRQWRDIREFCIARDEGMDLAVPGFEIYDKILIHHMNPMTVEQVEHGDVSILDPDFLITTTHNTHNAIHFGDRSLLRLPPAERVPGDTRLWG